jgi:hypothetical protein
MAIPPAVNKLSGHTGHCKGLMAGNHLTEQIGYLVLLSVPQSSSIGYHLALQVNAVGIGPVKLEAVALNAVIEYQCETFASCIRSARTANERPRESTFYGQATGMSNRSKNVGVCGLGRALDNSSIRRLVVLVVAGRLAPQSGFCRPNWWRAQGMGVGGSSRMFPCLPISGSS